jgi:hypothetical protein
MHLLISANPEQQNSTITLKNILNGKRLKLNKNHKIKTK